MILKIFLQNHWMNFNQFLHKVSLNMFKFLQMNDHSYLKREIMILWAMFY